MGVKARKAVLFATGGFTHDPDLRRNFLSIPVYGGCAAMTNEGDFVRISSTLGVQLRNMNYAWMCPIVLEKALNDDPALIERHGAGKEHRELAADDRGRMPLRRGIASERDAVAVQADLDAPDLVRRQIVLPAHRDQRIERRVGIAAARIRLHADLHGLVDIAEAGDRREQQHAGEDAGPLQRGVLGLGRADGQPGARRLFDLPPLRHRPAGRR